jgi:TPR repeat protein
MFAAGKGVPQDDKQAVKWYRLAAEQGHANAQYNLGLCTEMAQAYRRTTSMR